MKNGKMFVAYTSKGKATKEAVTLIGEVLEVGYGTCGAVI